MAATSASDARAPAASVVTPRQELNALLFLGPLAFVFIGELALLLTRPAWLAMLAYLPTGRPRRLLLEPRVRAALSRSASYRDAAAAELDLTPLAATPVLDLTAVKVRFDPDGRRATFRLPLGRMFALSGACRVDVAVDRDAVTLRARLMPTLAPTGAAFFLPLLVVALLDGSPEGATIVSPVMAGLFVLFQTVGALRCRADFRGTVDAVLDILEARITALG